MALLDMAGVASVMPFLTVLSNPELIKQIVFENPLIYLLNLVLNQLINLFFGILLFLFLILHFF